MTAKRSRSRGKPGETLQVVIRSDGQVAFRQLTQEMLEIALALAPEDPRLQARASGKPGKKQARRLRSQDPRSQEGP